MSCAESWSSMVQRACWCLVCAVGFACESDLDWSLDNKSCSVNGACLAGYVCSTDRRCVRAELAASTPPVPAADGRKPPAMTKPSFVAARSTASRAHVPAEMPAVSPPAQMPRADDDSEEVTESSAPVAQGEDAGTAGPTTSGTGGGGGPLVQQPASSPAGAAAPSPPEDPRTDASMPTCGLGSGICGSVCVDLQHDPEHCGACDRQCGASEHGVAFCDVGRCELRCETDFSRCGSACVRLDQDPLNCGECARECPGAPAATPTCSGGRCGKQCRPGFHACGDACVDLLRDPANCNGCGLSCPSSRSGMTSCENGVCELRCPEGQVACDGSCVAQSVTCFNSAGLTTATGPVCFPGARVCAGHCVWPNDDPAHCGQCNHACNNAERCNAGRCSRAR